MTNRTTLFFSTLLSVFVLAAVATVVSFTSAQAEPVNDMAQNTSLASISQPKAVQISGQEAAQIAATFLASSQPSSVTLSDQNGEAVYLIRFENGDEAYVAMNGDLLLVQLAPPPSEPVPTGYSEYAEEDHEEHEDREHYEDDHEDEYEADDD